MKTTTCCQENVKPQNKKRWTVTTGLGPAGTPAPLGPRLWPGREGSRHRWRGWPWPACSSPRAGGPPPSVDAQGPGSYGDSEAHTEHVQNEFFTSKVDTPFSIGSFG